MDRRTRIDSELLSESDKMLFYTPEADDDTRQLEVHEQVVRISNEHTLLLSLPSVAEAAGLEYSISVDSDTAAVTLTDFGAATVHDSINWEGNYTLDAEEDRIVLKSDGREWIVVENQIA